MSRFNEELSRALIEERLRHDLRDNLDILCDAIIDEIVLCVKRLSPVFRDYYEGLAELSGVNDGETKDE